MKIAFVLTVHLPDDERVWFQESSSLQKAGHEIFVVSSRTTQTSLPHSFCFDDTGMPKKELIATLASSLMVFSPDVIICDNPMAILAAQQFKRQKNKKAHIVYDVTEWYPSQKNLKNLPLFKKIIKAGLLTAFSYYAAWFLDGFIFGEYYKARPFRLFFPWTKYVYLSYYSDIQQIISYPPRDISKECICLYSGPLIQGKGFDKVLNVVSNCAKRFPETQFILYIISKDDLDNSFSHIQNLKVEKQSFLPFPDFCETIGKADLFFDLRDIDFETTHCLPIKLFYYLATGRPVVYSNLKAIRKEVSEMYEIGVFMDPKNTDAIVSQMAQYLQNNDFYKKQCYFARQLAEEKYNWEKIEQPFIQFIQSFF